MYIVTAFTFFMLGGLLALVIRTELAVPGLQFIDEATYNQLFGMHAMMMIFLFVMPMTTGLANYIVPLQIGAADMAFPRINALSFWMLVVGAILILSAFAFGGAPTGWTLYAPLSAIDAGAGVDLLLLGLVVLGISSILGAINFLVTIFKMRAPGMTLLRMPMFCWTTLVTSVLLLFSIPVVTAGLIMLFIDRNYGGGFFDPAQGGSPILWQHIFWFFGHPEVYILILPAFGIISEIIPVFSRKPLFGYKAFVIATASIGALGFTVWAHHMFTTGAVFLPFFTFFTFLIAVPTGVKFFNWLATMWGGQLRFDTPMLYAVGFIALFLIGGLDGAFLAVVPFDFMVQDTYWVVSHIHYVLVAGAVFAIFAALFYWFPKMTGRRLDERLGKVQFWILFIGTNLAFFPQHMLGLDGMIRRIPDYSGNAGWTELNFLSTIGAFIIAVSVLPFLWNVFVTLRKPRSTRPTRGTATRSSGRPPARRRPTTSTRCRRSTPSGPGSTSSTPAWDMGRRRAGRADEGDGRVTADTKLLTTTGHDDPEVSGHDAKRGGMDPALLGMMLFIASEVMFFAALFAAYFNAKATLPVLAAGGRRGRPQALPGAAHRDGHPARLIVHDAVGHEPHPQG